MVAMFHITSLLCAAVQVTDSRYALWLDKLWSRKPAAHEIIFFSSFNAHSVFTNFPGNVHHGFVELIITKLPSQIMPLILMMNSLTIPYGICLWTGDEVVVAPVLIIPVYNCNLFHNETKTGTIVAYKVEEPRHPALS